MPNIRVADLVNSLTARTRQALEAADTNQDAQLSSAERSVLPADVRPLADNVADRYFQGGGLPIGAYVDAYARFASERAAAADANDNGVLTPGEQDALPASLYSSVAALRASATSAPSPVTGPGGPDLEVLHRTLSAGGWTDDKLVQFIDEVVAQNKVDAFTPQLWDAVLDPATDGASGHTGGRFYEALAWYTDKTLAGSGNGSLSLQELQGAMQKKGQEYFSHYGDPSHADARRQTFKFIQKLSLLEQEIDRQGGTGYTYDAAAMGQVNHNNAWNAAHTLDSRAEFQDKVISASYDRPVLVKYGLTYCVHCLLLEQLDSVHAVADKHAGELDVYKVWWNPHDPALAEVSQLAADEGVTSSPFFIVYDQGQPVRAGYAFPDEDGGGMDDLLHGVL